MLTKIKKKKAIIKRNNKGHIQPGQVLNPKGRAKGSTNRYSISDLCAAIKNVEKVKQQKFMEVWIEAAWGKADRMAKIAEFMLPKLRTIEGFINTFESAMDDDLAKLIQDKLRKRME